MNNLPFCLVSFSLLLVQQAKELEECYQDKHLDVIFCSDISLFHETGEIAFGKRNIPVIRDRRLHECSYGDFTQYPSKKVKSLKKKYEDYFLEC